MPFGLRDGGAEARESRTCVAGLKPSGSPEQENIHRAGEIVLSEIVTPFGLRDPGLKPVNRDQRGRWAKESV